MDLIFQFGRILAVCFLAELLAGFLPLPIPASVYGLILMLLSLRLGILKLAQVKKAAAFLVSILPLLFLPAAVGVLELLSELKNLLLPCLLAVVPVTVLVMAASGRTTQAIQRLQKRKEHPHG